MTAKVNPVFSVVPSFDAGIYLSKSLAVGLSYEVDSALSNGTRLFGVFGRSYLTNSFFLQGAAGYSEYFSNDGYSVNNNGGLGTHAVIGNEWRLDSGLLLGGDWIGFHFCSARLDYPARGLWISWPKMRIGLAF